MKIRHIAVALVFIIFTQCYSIDSTRLIDAIDHLDQKAVIEFFDEIAEINQDEAQELISNLYDYYASEYGYEILEESNYPNYPEGCPNEYFKNLQTCMLPQQFNFSDEHFCGNKKRRKLMLKLESPVQWF